jgi:purine-binding chemotaxis protein CheW
MPQAASTPGLIVRIPGALCAFPLSAVVETMRVLPIKALADLPEFVAGAAVIRGVPTPVVDLAVLLGTESAESGPRRPRREGRLVTLRTGERVLAMLVESVVGISALDEYRVQPLAPLLRSARPQVVQALGHLDSELLVLLDHASVLPEAAWKAVRSAGVAG